MSDRSFPVGFASGAAYDPNHDCYFVVSGTPSVSGRGERRHGQLSCSRDRRNRLSDEWRRSIARRRDSRGVWTRQAWRTLRQRRLVPARALKKTSRHTSNPRAGPSSNHWMTAPHPLRLMRIIFVVLVCVLVAFGLTTPARPQTPRQRAMVWALVGFGCLRSA